MRRAALVMAMVCCAACGAAAGSPRGAAGDEPQTARAAPADADDEPDLSPAPAPSGLAAVIYLTRPRELQRWLSTSAGGGATLEAIAVFDLQALAARFVGPDLASAFDFDRPLYLSSTDLENDATAVSIAANADLDTLRSRLSEQYVFRRVGSGAYALEAHSGKTEVACEVRRAFGAAPVRFVCAPSAAIAAAHAPYATRTLPRALPKSLLRIESTRAAYEKTLGDASKIQQALGDGADAPFVSALLRELFGGASGSALELQPLDDGVELAAEIEVSSAESGLLMPLVTSPTRRAADASPFWRLPADSALAFHVTGGDPSRMRTMNRAVLSRLLALVPEHDLDATGKAESLEPLSEIALTGGPLTFAQGIALERAERALRAYTAKKASLEQTRRALAPWSLLHVREPLARWESAFAALDAADERSRKRLAAGGVKPPSSERENRYETRTQRTAMTAADRLPKGSIHWVKTHTPNPRYAPKEAGDKPAGVRHTSHVFLVPDGDGLWFGFGDDAALVRDKLRTALGSTTAPRLDSVAALAGLKHGENIGFGFATPEIWLGWTLDGDSATEVATAEKSLAELKPMLAARTTPISLLLTGPGRDPSPESPAVVRLSARVPAAILAALAAVP